MCAVHLIPEQSEVRVVDNPTIVAVGPIICNECNDLIGLDDEYQFIVGHLDDGSPGQWRYIAHLDCYQFAEMDVRDDGCFTYGGATLCLDE